MRQRQLIEKAVGPAPLYWQTFPELTGASGKKYIWKHHGDSGPLANMVALSPRQAPEHTLLALNRFCRAFAVPQERGELAGIWCPEPAAARGESPYLRVMCFDPDQLQRFTLEQVAGWFMQSNDRIYSATAPLAEFEISSALEAGKHPVEIPQAFAKLQELILVSPYPASHGATTAVMIVRPQERSAEVLPQPWFQPEEKDRGFQWIGRVTRDPVTGRLIGDGVRVRCFELTEDGTQLARWIE